MILLTAQAQDAQKLAEAAAHNRAGMQHHGRRCLTDASREYARALELDPPRELNPDEWRLVRRFAPRVYVTPTEFFSLKDAAVILHPAARLIAYHFFWEDDVDFPEDNDPCDHELMWVAYASDGQRLENVWTYFHGHILKGGPAALDEARRHRQRPRVNVQWGKHGSLPFGWEGMAIPIEKDDADAGGPAGTTTLKAYNEQTYLRLAREGTRLQRHPLAERRGWPVVFRGRWEDFVNFSRPVEVMPLVEKRRYALVSRYANAVINRYFLTYNFSAKTEWPTAEGR